MDVEKSNGTNRENDNWRKSLCLSTRKYSRIMAAIILAILQIFLLFLKAHYTKKNNQEQALEHLRAAQAILSELATAFEEKIRYSSPQSDLIDQLEDSMDSERKNHDLTSHH